MLKSTLLLLYMYIDLYQWLHRVHLVGQRGRVGRHFVFACWLDVCLQRTRIKLAGHSLRLPTRVFFLLVLVLVRVSLHHLLCRLQLPYLSCSITGKLWRRARPEEVSRDDNYPVLLLL